MRKQKLGWLLALLAVFALLAASCGDDSSDSADDSDGDDAPVDDSDDAVDDVVDDVAPTLRVAIVAPSASNDLAFTQSMVDAVDAMSADVEVAITDGTFIVDEAAAAIRGYADDGFDLVIAHGSQYGGPLAEIAPDFPDTTFAWGTAADNFGLDNVFAYTVRADEGGFVNGTIAAALTESGVIGVVGPIEVGDAKLYIDGFVAGVASVDDSIEVNVNYIESFGDVALAAEAATAHIGNGADVLTGTAQMVVGATGVAQEEGVAWFGTQANQTALGEEIVVASQVYHWEVLLDEIVAAMESGDPGSVLVASLANGGLVIEYNDAYDLDAGIQTDAEATTAGLADGSISTGIG